MTQVRSRSPHALTAIAAVLAIGSTPVLAQDSGASAPALTLPQDVNSASPVDAAKSTVPVTGAAEQPTIVLPQAEPDATVSQPLAMPVAPVAQPETSTINTSAASNAADTNDAGETGAAAPAERSPEQRPDVRETSAAAANNRREAAPVTVPDAADAGTAADGALAQGDVSDPAQASPLKAASPADERAQPDAAPANENNGNEDSDLPIEGILGLLAAAGIAGAGIMAMRSRRKRVRQPRSREAMPGTYKPASVYRPAAAPASSKPATASAAASGPAEMPRAAAPAPASRPLERKVQAPVAGSGPVPTGEARRELLERMVAAAPDAANPFISRKARMRRARIQLQHREHLQKQGMAQSFDWRTYRPTTKPSTPTPPLVEA
ncbi:hypothetical protein [Novosphingobium pentaromativorans]|uniref:Uncharacterized protein n=1 Tax=Novosphingobium pentaromativorans US6-1 TaxID=1088721 RepID=G6EB38_9SPHN|nr:hypothetical protein [Novosphingobium pentaromativorans]AIT80516.1 hypothetical protein JI59_12380 [Novosphingobium pentaromativorans US6-1]EHJ61505.1 hypothetical protein NSU_1559 [Novosphingobium pentaromativorans US6-1]